MYTTRPYSSETIEFDLPKTMYSVQPVLQQPKQLTNLSELKDIERRQDVLLDKLEQLYNQLILYKKNQNSIDLNLVPIRKELVVHLSAKQPSKNILNLIEKFRDNLSIRTYRHSSLRDVSFDNYIQNLSSTNNQNKKHSLAIIWADDDDNLPYMFHSQMKINDEQSIVNLLSHQLTKND
ncbi:unnamed protein product [Rotaria sordida]|uniref:Uncharacterized protein n=2 Tax=Rotaria sordida TaxID=392033 RepID=A0A815SSL1_9BILA|nr:unnamed protein product [Rotaria sordida]CAF1494229.1 unnamed protein product [Rotaria sordida]